MASFEWGEIVGLEDQIEILGRDLGNGWALRFMYTM